MANNKIEESQQVRDGIAIGTQGNQKSKGTMGMSGPNEKPQEDIPGIPNQERSSATNQREEEKDRNDQ